MRRNRDKFRSNDNRFGKSGRNSWPDKNNSKRSGDIKVVSTNVTKEETKENKPGFSLRQQRDQQKSRNDSFKRFKREDSRNNYNSNSNNNTNNSNNTNNIKRERSSSFKENVPFHVKTFEKEKCAYCEKNIDDMPSAIFDKEKNQYYHFNCVLNKLIDENGAQNRERVVYLGSGAFGVIENQDNGNRFTIKKKIQFITAG